MNGHSLVSEILRRDVTFDGSTPLSQIEGWDSLRGVKLILRIEEIAGTELSESDIETLRTVDDIDRILKSDR